MFLSLNSNFTFNWFHHFKRSSIKISYSSSFSFNQKFLFSHSLITGIQICELHTTKWQQLPEPIVSRLNATICAAKNNTCYLIGGKDPMTLNLLKSVEYFDGTKWNVLPCMNRGHTSIVAVWHKKRLFVFSYLSEIFDGQVWKKIADIPLICCDQHSVYDNEIYLYSNDGYLFVYNILTDKWNSCERSPLNLTIGLKQCS